jgi:hypothetical protein
MSRSLGLVALIVLGAACETRPGALSSASNSPTPLSSTPLATVAAPSASATGPLPVGFVLPASCSFVGSPTQTGTTTQWRVDCGAQGNRSARNTLGPAFQDQGWTTCTIGLGQAVYAKSNYMDSIQEPSGAPGDEFIPLTQRPRSTETCP